MKESLQIPETAPCQADAPAKPPPPQPRAPLTLPQRVTGAILRRLRWLHARLDRRFASLAARSELLASLYYAIYSKAFFREHRAVLQGRLRYLQDTANPTLTLTLLRRNTHRLEKGILSRPRRSVFALDYIDETVAGYQRALKSLEVAGPAGCSLDELKWAHDVLANYFDVTGSHPRLDKLRDRFRQLPDPTRDLQGEFVPYHRNLERPPSVAYDDLLELAHRRRSVRWFLQKPVPREAIDDAIRVAAQSPSACNRQPFQFRVFDDPELVPKVAALPLGTRGFSQNFPAIAVVVGKLRSYFDERDRHLIYIDSSLAVMGFVYALECQGLSSCCINWPDIEERERKVAEIVKLEPDERAIMFIAVGYPDPDGLVAYSSKKPLTVLRRYNFE